MNHSDDTVGEYLKTATKILASKSIPSPRLDVLILMEFILGTDRASILARPDNKITQTQINLLNRAISKRSKHVPVTHITHKTEFYGRTFYIDNRVLQPRPETETMIDLYISVITNDQTLSKRSQIANGIRVADVGTGSGAIGITAKLECKNIQIDLIDIDPKAIKVAKSNVVLHTIEAKPILADLLPDTDNTYDILLCNLPYIPDGFHINLAAAHEPEIAIFGGSDGMGVYRKLFKLVNNLQHMPLYILTESLPSSHAVLKSIASNSDYELLNHEDFIQVFKLKA